MSLQWNSNSCAVQGPRSTEFCINNPDPNQRSIETGRDFTGGRITDRETAGRSPRSRTGQVPVLRTAANRNNTNTDTEFFYLLHPRRLGIPPRISSSIYGAKSRTGAGGPSPRLHAGAARAAQTQPQLSQPQHPATAHRRGRSQQSPAICRRSSSWLRLELGKRLKDNDGWYVRERRLRNAMSFFCWSKTRVAGTQSLSRVPLWSPRIFRPAG